MLLIKDLINRCFEIDYDNTQIKKFTKSNEEEEELRAFLKENYSKIKETYHYLAALDTKGNLLCVTQNVFSEFIKQINLIDPNFLKFSDIDIIYLSTYVPMLKLNKDIESLTGRFLIRFQFMDVLIRLANDRFVKSGAEKNIVLATKKLFSEHLIPFYQEFDSSSWRKSRFWNVDCDHVLKYFWHFLTFLYKKFASKSVTSIFGMNSMKYMYLQEFKKIFQDAGLIDNFFVERDANLAFSLSIKYYENELTADKIIQLSFPEFLEAIARAAEKISPIPVGIVDVIFLKIFNINKE